MLGFESPKWYCQSKNFYMLLIVKSLKIMTNPLVQAWNNNIHPNRTNSKIKNSDNPLPLFQWPIPPSLYSLTSHLKKKEVLPDFTNVRKSYLPVLIWNKNGHSYLLSFWILLEFKKILTEGQSRIWTFIVSSLSLRESADYFFIKIWFSIEVK